MMEIVRITTGEIDNDIPPSKWQGDESKKSDEDDNNESWRLLLCPEKNSMDVIPEKSQTIIKYDAGIVFYRDNVA